MKTNTSLRLEQALRHWENRAFMRYALYRMVERHQNLTAGRTVLEALGNAPIFAPSVTQAVRGKLLHAATVAPQDDLLEKERDAGSVPIAVEGLLWNLFGWCRSSRRIYQLPSDLQLLLQATSLRGLIMDIKLPFNAFAVQIEEPLDLGDGEAADTILLHKYGTVERPHLCVSLLPTSLEHVHQLHPLEREQVRRALERDDAEKIVRLLRTNEERTDPSIRSFAIEISDPDLAPAGTPVSDGSVRSILEAFEGCVGEEDSPELARARTNALRIVFGLSLYLSTLPAAENDRNAWSKEPKQKGTLRVITNEAHVCMVQNVHVLTPEERNAFRRHASGGVSDVSPHFREGYWSRPPGKGHDPMAQKTIWHRPTIVRRDLLPDGTLPYGSERVLKT